MLIAFFVPACVVIFFVIGNGLNEVQGYFPSKNYMNVFSYNDEHDKGNSGVNNLLITGSKVIMDYSLENGSPYPLIGLVFQQHEKYLSIPDDAIVFFNMIFDAPSLRVCFKIDIPEFSRTGDPLTYLVLEAVVVKNENSSEYQIPLNRFNLAQWWCDLQEKKLDWQKAIDYSRIRSIELVDSSSALSKKQKLEVREIFFKKPVQSYYITLFAAILTYYLVYFIIFKPWRPLARQWLCRKKKARHQNGELDDKALRIIQYMNQHYNEADLALARVAEAAAVSPNKVSVILKSEFQLSFKSYLNQIRLEEARRLLRESDRQIADIAHLLGYNNPSHFTRTFKQYIGISPGEYRKKHLH